MRRVYADGRADLTAGPRAALAGTDGRAVGLYGDMRRTPIPIPILIVALAAAPVLPAGAEPADAPPSLCPALLDDPVNSTVVVELIEQGADPAEVCMVSETTLVWSGGTHILRDLSRGLRSSGTDPIGKGLVGLVMLPLVPVFGIIDALTALGDGPSRRVREIAIGPLHLAVQHAEPKAIAALIDAGAPLDQADGYGVPPVVYAMERALARDELEPAELLFEAGATLDVWDSLDAATVRTISRDPELLALTCAHGLDVDATGAGEAGPALHDAVLEGDQQAVRQLAACGADLGRDRGAGEWPHALAARGGDEAMLDLLIELGADVDRRAGPSSPTALAYATRDGDTPTMRLLLDRGADPDNPEWFETRLLHTAAREHQPEAMRLLLEYGAEVDPATEDGRTPLQLAVDHDCAACAELLLLHGAAPGPWATRYAEEAAGPQARVMTRTLLDGGLEPTFGVLENAVLSDQPEHIAFVFAHDEHRAPMYGRLLRIARNQGLGEETQAVVEAERDARRPGARRRAARAAAAGDSPPQTD